MASGRRRSDGMGSRDSFEETKYLKSCLEKQTRSIFSYKRISARLDQSFRKFEEEWKITWFLACLKDYQVGERVEWLEHFQKLPAFCETKSLYLFLDQIKKIPSLEHLFVWMLFYDYYRALKLQRQRNFILKTRARAQSKVLKSN